MNRNKTRNRSEFQRESLRQSLSIGQPIPPEAGIDLSEFSRAAALRIYKRRWLVLLIYSLFVITNKIQCLQYAIIVDLSVKFFNVSSMAVKSTVLIWSISFVILLYPITWLLHKKGMRFVCVLASASICIGTWIKYFATSPDQFTFIFVGQFLVGIWQLITESLPATLAANWFAQNQIALATAIGWSGTFIGVALSAVIGPIVIKNHDEVSEIGNDLKYYTLWLGFYCTCVFILMFFFFTAEPKLPPSKSRALQKLCASDDFEFFTYIRRLLKNKNFVILWNAHGLIVGTQIAVNTSLSTLFVHHFKNGEEHIWRIALLFIGSGLLGPMVFGRVLDRLKIFKLLSVILVLANILTILLLAAAVYFEIPWTIYVSIALYGFFTHGYHTTSFEVCAEFTYPEPVTISVTILSLANQFYSAILIASLDKLMIAYSDVGVYTFLILASIIGFILTCLTGDERRRQKAGKLQ